MFLISCVGQVQTFQHVDNVGHKILKGKHSIKVNSKKEEVEFCRLLIAHLDYILVVLLNHPLKLLVNVSGQSLNSFRHDALRVFRAVKSLALHFFSSRSIVIMQWGYAMGKKTHTHTQLRKE